MAFPWVDGVRYGNAPMNLRLATAEEIAAVPSPLPPAPTWWCFGNIFDPVEAEAAKRAIQETSAPVHLGIAGYGINDPSVIGMWSKSGANVDRFFAAYYRHVRALRADAVRTATYG